MPIRRHKLGNSELEVPILCLGTMTWVRSLVQWSRDYDMGDRRLHDGHECVLSPVVVHWYCALPRQAGEHARHLSLIDLETPPFLHTPSMTMPHP